MPQKFGPSLSLLVWGVVVGQVDEQLRDLLSEEIRERKLSSLYLSGWGALTFEELQDGAASVVPYEPALPPEVGNLRRANGGFYTLRRPWQSPLSSDRSTYYLESYLESPHGHLTLEIVATGKVHLRCDPKEFVTWEMLTQSLIKYSPDVFRERQLAALLLR